MKKLFVYGTLKRGYGNHKRLTGATFLGLDSIEDSALLDLGFFPGMVERPGSRAYGEVFLVTDEHLRRTDLLEGVPHFYRRETRTTTAGIEVETYYLNRDADRRDYRTIESGLWDPADREVARWEAGR